MLMALLYTSENEIAAAAPACDHAPYGDRYWNEFHPTDLATVEFFETAYITIADRDLQNRLLNLGTDNSIDGYQLAMEVEQKIAPVYFNSKAA